jgi:hypothetical protein
MVAQYPVSASHKPQGAWWRNTLLAPAIRALIIRILIIFARFI